MSKSRMFGMWILVLVVAFTVAACQQTEAGPAPTLTATQRTETQAVPTATQAVAAQSTPTATEVMEAQATPTATAMATQPVPTPTETLETQPTETPAATEAPGQVEVVMRNIAFDPQEITVPVGTTVVWRNEDAFAHTVTSGTRGDPTGLFDSGNVAGGGSFEFTFEEPGTYEYFCRIHPGMDGTIIVE